MKTKVKQALRNTVWNGPTKFHTWDKFVWQWLKHMATLKRYDACPPDDELVTNFILNITDPCLDSAIDAINRKGSPESQDFDKFLTNSLANKTICEGHTKSRRAICCVTSA